MIMEKVGNVLKAEEGIIVHGCNCQGVMGGGIALEIRNTFPRVFQEYRKKFEAVDPVTSMNHFDGLRLGDIQPVQVEDDKWIVNAMTQWDCGHGRRYVDYDAVARCFEKVRSFTEDLNHVRELQNQPALPVLFPMIGAGLAGGNWKIISTIIDEELGDNIMKIFYRFQP
jgi:O-acetyl-ADP-ribose deacetylase (regulator of RNase III)